MEFLTFYNQNQCTTLSLNHNNLENVYLETFLGMYKYAHLNANSPEAEKHRTNIVALLDLIFQRDFKEHHMPQRTRRRRRRRK